MREFRNIPLNSGNLCLVYPPTGSEKHFEFFPLALKYKSHWDLRFSGTGNKIRTSGGAITVTYVVNRISVKQDAMLKFRQVLDFDRLIEIRSELDRDFVIPPSYKASTVLFEAVTDSVTEPTDIYLIAIQYPKVVKASDTCSALVADLFHETFITSELNQVIKSGAVDYNQLFRGSAVEDITLTVEVTTQIDVEQAKFLFD